MFIVRSFHSMKVPIYYTVLYFKLMHYKYWRITAVLVNVHCVVIKLNESPNILYCTLFQVDALWILKYHSCFSKCSLCGHFIQWKSQCTILYFISSWCIINIEGSQLFVKCSLCSHFIQWKCLYTWLLTILIITVRYIYLNHYNTWHLLMKYLHTAICKQVVSYSCYTCVNEAVYCKDGSMCWI